MKIRFYLAMAAAALVMTNCSQEEELVKAPNASKTINATIEGASRSAVTDAGVFSWTSGDKISLLDESNNDTYTYSGSGNGFNPPTPVEVTTPVVAYYPASASHTTTTFNLPAYYGDVNTEYAASTNAAMIATPPTQGNDYAFMHLGGVMRFIVKNVPDNATGFKFTASGKNISGSFDVKDNNGVKTIETTDGQSNTVSILFQASNVARDMTFYVPMPVGEYGDYTVALIIGNDEKGYESTNVTNTIARKTLLLMPAFTYNETTQELDKSTAKVGVIDLEEGTQEANINANADVVVTPGTDADATATLNYTPADDGTSVLSISDGSGATESGESKGKVVVATSGNATIASCDINAPNLTVELRADGGTEVTYGEVTALTAQQTLIIGKGVTITKLTGNGGNVLINGGKVQEWSKGKGENITITYVAKTAEDFKSIPDFAEVVKLGGAITATEAIEIKGSVTIDGGNNTITSNASRVIELKASNIKVTMKDLKIESTAVRTSGGNIRGINIVPDMKNVELTLDGCSVEFTDGSAHESSFAVNQTDEDENSNTITINGGTYNGANVINVWGDGHTVTIDGATLTSLYKPHDTYHGNGVRLEGKGVNLTVKNTTFEGVNAKAISQKHEGENTIIEENNTNNAKNHVAKAGSTYYYSLEEAITEAGNDEVKLLCDITLSESIEIKGSVTIDGGNNTIISNASRVIELKASDINVTMKDLKIESTAVRSSGDIRGINIVPDMLNVELTLDGCSVEFTDESAHDKSYAVNQTDEDENCNTITINGGTYNGANVINVWGDGHTVTIDGATLTSLYKPHDTYHGNGVRLEGKGVNLTVKNTTFNGENAKAISQKYENENTIDFENNDNVNNTQTSEPQE